MIQVKINENEPFECSSMYEAHTWKIFAEANGRNVIITKDGKEVNNLPEYAISFREYELIK